MSEYEDLTDEELLEEFLDFGPWSYPRGNPSPELYSGDWHRDEKYRRYTELREEILRRMEK